MSYIAHLKALTEEDRKTEIERKVLESQTELLNDPSRTKLLDDDQMNSWDDIDKITIESVGFDDTTDECIAEICWESHGPCGEDDERFMSGNATAALHDDESVTFSNATATLDE